MLGSGRARAAENEILAIAKLCEAILSNAEGVKRVASVVEKNQNETKKDDD